MIKFDTRDKKPNLYGLLALAVLFAAVIGLLIHLYGDKSGLNVCLLIAAFCLISIIYLLITLREQIRYNPYSYNTIYYVGFAVFALFVMTAHIVLAFLMARHPESYGSEKIARYLLNSARDFMKYTSPLILVFSVSLFVSNVSLIRHEGKRLVNVLGIILAFLLVAGEAVGFWFGNNTPSLMHNLASTLFAAVYLYFECMLIGVAAAFVIVTRYEPEPDKDYMIILGCGIRKDGTPSPLLKGRVDRALEFTRKQKEQTGKELTFVTSGGKGPDEVISESASMKRYLMEKGVSEDHIIEEDASASTFENMKFSKEKIMETGVPGKIAFSTTNYHVFRSGLYARRVKMRAVGIGAPTKWYFWPNASVREFVGLLTEHRGKQFLIIFFIIAFYTALTLQSF